MASESKITFTFGTTAIEGYLEVTSMGDLGNEVVAHAVTTLADTVKQKLMSSIKDGGEISLEVFHDRTDTPSVGTAFETITVFLDGTKVADFSGALRSYKISAGVDAPLTATAAITVNGKITLY